jgi:hypothetical protein
MGKQWNQRQVWKRRVALIASGIFLLLLVSVSRDAVKRVGFGGQGDPVQLARVLHSALAF